MPIDTSSLPHDFVWGAATASYQIEGAAHEDGRGESVWDRFCATPGKVRNGDSGEIACDFYHRYRDDVALMRELGLDAFRFSIAWPRVMPTGAGRSTRPGSTSTTASSTSCSRTTSSRSRRSSTGTRRRRSRTRAAGRHGRPRRRSSSTPKPSSGRLGDRVQHWITHNEPWVHAWIGHAWGEHAPGRTSEADAVAAAHHLLLSHGWAVQAIRAAAPHVEVGITLNLAHAYAATDSPENEAAAWRVDGEGNRWFLDPLFRGSYPADLLERNELVAPFVRDGDLEAIAAPIDFLGVNNYFRFVVERRRRAAADRARPRGAADRHGLGGLPGRAPPPARPRRRPTTRRPRST